MQHFHILLGLLGLYLEAKGLSSEVAALVVDQTKLQLEGTSPVYWHPDLQIQEHESQMAITKKEEEHKKCGRRKRK